MDFMNKTEKKYFDENGNECQPEIANTIIIHIVDEMGRLVDEKVLNKVV